MAVGPVRDGFCRGICRSSTKSTAGFWKQVALRWPNEPERLRRTVPGARKAPTKLMRMAHLAVVGCHSVNGVSALHIGIAENRPVP